MVVGVIQPRHNDERLAAYEPVLRNIRPRKIARPVDLFLNEIFKRMFVDSVSWTDPTDGALPGRQGDAVQRAPDDVALFGRLQIGQVNIVDPAMADDFVPILMQLLERV